MLEQPPYSPDLAPANFWFFPRVKIALAGKTLSAETFKKEVGRGHQDDRR